MGEKEIIEKGLMGRWRERKRVEEREREREKKTVGESKSEMI